MVVGVGVGFVKEKNLVREVMLKSNHHSYKPSLFELQQQQGKKVESICHRQMLIDFISGKIFVKKNVSLLIITNNIELDY